MHLGVRCRRGEGKEVQSFFFLVKEHISPGAGEGEDRERGGREGDNGVRDGGAYLTSLLATSP